MTGALLQVRSLGVTYATSRGGVRAAMDVSFDVAVGEAVGIVGESGSGKSTVLRALLRLLPRSTRVEGQVLYRGRDLLALGDDDMRRVRGGDISLIVQDPVNAFNPAFTIGDQLRRILRLHRRERPPGGYDTEISRMLRRVGVDPTGKLTAYPFNFSQGQLQRIMIAAACLAGRPLLLLADEPTTSLDVSVEAQVLQLLRELRGELGLAVLLVTHNLAVVAELCDRVLVMYAGRVVEQGDIYAVFERPRHPYTQQLLKSIPTFPHSAERLQTMPGGVPDLLTDPRGCPFAPRCERHLGPICDSVPPALVGVTAEGQLAACHLYSDASVAHA